MHDNPAQGCVLYTSYRSRLRSAAGFSDALKGCAKRVEAYLIAERCRAFSDQGAEQTRREPEARENFIMEKKPIQSYFGQLGPTLAIVGGVCVILLVVWLLSGT